MCPISFSRINMRKIALNKLSPKYEKISYRTAKENLNANNVLLFAESGYEDATKHANQSLKLYNHLLRETSDILSQVKDKIENVINSNLISVSDLNSVYDTLCNCDDIPDKRVFFNTLEELENCDRVIRNESRLTKRFDLQKSINESIGYGLRHTVFELCSLLDTYNMNPKAKLNVALENISYTLFKSGNNVNMNEVTEYIVEYFLTRDPIITDKDYDGYIDILENNQFMDSSNPNISYVFEAKTIKGNSYKDKLEGLINQCETVECKKQISKINKIKNEKQASTYIDDTVEMILSDNFSKIESSLLLKSIYILPLIGDISKQFVNYKLEMSKKKLKIKQKVADKDNEDFIKKLLDDGELIDAAAFVSENLQFNDYILDDHYICNEFSDMTLDMYLEGAIKDAIKDSIKKAPEKDDTEAIDNIINSFKASNEKSTSKFNNMLHRILSKSPGNIINSTPNIFAIVRIMLYLGISAAVPLGPIFAAVLAFINKLIGMHLDIKQAEKLLNYLKSEKEKAEKKLEKLSGKEKDNQKEYINTLDKCIKSVKDFIRDIDDDNENIQDDDDFDFGDDFNWESAIMESRTLCDNSPAQQVLDLIDPYMDQDILSNLSDLFDNCYTSVSNKFYDKVENMMNESVTDKNKYKSILENRGSGKLFPEEEPGFIAQYNANLALQEIANQNKKKKGGGNFVATAKMALLNFKKKAQNLHGKEQELWRNIDIATNQITNGIQQALTSDRREAIIKGSIIPSFSKCIKYAISVGAVGAFTGPVGAVIAAVGMLGASKYLNERERKLLYDEIDTELQVVEKQLQMAENDGDMNQYRFLLNYQKKLQREKYRIKYGIHMSGRTIPEIKRRG